MHEHPGGCLCGYIRYQIAGAPVNSGYCHCRMCQRSSGAPVTAWATFPIESFRLTAGVLTTYQSSAEAVRHFCGHCGTPITFRNLHGPTTLDVTLSSLDDPEALPPQFHIWTSSQRRWLHIADELPRYPDGGPDTAQVGQNKKSGSAT
ncbi:MAG: GFA family protein [Chromatiales bacterium]